MTKDDISAAEIEFIRTSDFTLASTLHCLGYHIHGIDKRNRKRAVFYFKKDAELARDIERYWSNHIKINPLEFTRAQREINARIHTDID